jgi:hypothetical protein
MKKLNATECAQVAEILARAHRELHGIRRKYRGLDTVEYGDLLSLELQLEDSVGHWMRRHNERKDGCPTKSKKKAGSPKAPRCAPADSTSK